MLSDFVKLAVSSVEIKGANGEIYRLSPIGFREMAEFCIWKQFQNYETAKLAGVDKDTLKEIYQECTKAPVSFEQIDTIKSMTTPGGIAKLLYLSLRIAHPDVKERDVSKIINLADMQGDLADKLFAISGIDRKETQESGEA